MSMDAASVGVTATLAFVVFGSGRPLLQAESVGR